MNFERSNSPFCMHVNMKFFFVPILTIGLWSAVVLAQPTATTTQPTVSTAKPEASTAKPEASTAAPADASAAPKALTPKQQRAHQAATSKADSGTNQSTGAASIVQKDNWVCSLVATHFDFWRLELVLTTLTTYRLGDCSPKGMDQLTTASASAQLRTVSDFKTVFKAGASQQIMDINLTPIFSEYYWVSNLKFAPSGTTRINLFELYRTTKLGSTKNLAGASYTPFAMRGESHFIWNPGTLVHRLVAPDGTAYLMFSYTRDVQPALTRETLSDLNDMLKLPPGWTYENYFLDKTIVVRSGLQNDNSIVVIFDDLNNNYVRYE